MFDLQLADVCRYLEQNLKIKLETSFNLKKDAYEVTAKLILENRVISEDTLTVESI